MNAFVTQYPNEWDRPSMEILLSGYSDQCRQPEIIRLTFSFNWQTGSFSADVTEEVKVGAYNVVFGGQYDVIQRVVVGVDINAYASLKNECWDILESYRREIQSGLDAASVNYTVPNINQAERKYDLFGRGFQQVGITGISSDVGSLSEQAGIDLVSFLINTMIKSQEFSSSIPTVGGDIHIGIIDASAGFRWISREEYRFENHCTPKF